MSSQTDYLISSRKDTNKAKRARSFGTKVIDEAEIALADKKLIFVSNIGGRPTSFGIARLLSTRNAQSGRKVLIIDTSGQLGSDANTENSKDIAGMSIASTEGGYDLLLAFAGTSFFTSSHFSKNIEHLLL